MKIIILCAILVVLVALAAGCSSDSTPTAAPVASGFTPAPVCVAPDTIDIDQAAAETLLIQLGLQPVISMQYDDNVPPGQVISQDPISGTRLDPCQGDVILDVSLGAAPKSTDTPALSATATLVPTNTPVSTDTPSPTVGLPTDTPEPTVTPTTVAVSDLPSGEWSVRADNTDDASVILVNGELIGASVFKRDSDWISIDSYFKPDEPNLVTVANWNGCCGKSWGFSIRKNETVVWGSEGNTGKEHSLNYAQTVEIMPDGTVEPVSATTGAYPTLSDSWSVRIRDTADIGAILVNGVPVAGAGNWGLEDTGWIDISGLLRSDQDNVISMYVWNFEADYSWRFSIRQNETIVWEQEGGGSGQTGSVYEVDVIINSNGSIIFPEAKGDAMAHKWAVRALDTDDASVMFVNGAMVGAAVFKRDTNWISIDEYLRPGIDNEIIMANWNGCCGKSWVFSIRRDETVIWGAEGNTGKEHSLNFAQTAVIQPDGTIEPSPPEIGAYPTLSDSWTVRIRDTADIGVILVNDIPVAGAGNWGLQDTDWIDITGLLRADQDNVISMYVWNFDADYSWRFSIRQNETTVWESEREGGGLTGPVFDARVVVTQNGDLVLP